MKRLEIYDMPESEAKTIKRIHLYGIAVICMLITTIAMYSASIDLIKDWLRFSEGYGHGLIIFLLFIYLLHNEFKGIT